MNAKGGSWNVECGKNYENMKLGSWEVVKVGRCEDGRRKNRMQKSAFSKQIVTFFYLKPGALPLNLMPCIPILEPFINSNQ